MGLKRAVNVGITGFSMRRLPLQDARYEAFVQVEGQSDEPIAATLEVRVDGHLATLRKMTLEPGGRERLLLPIEADEKKILTLKVDADGDALAADNVVYAQVPAARPIRVAWVTESADPFTQLALTTLGRNQDVEVIRVEPDAWPIKDDVDVVLFDRWAPQPWSSDHAALVLDPPHDVGPVKVRRLDRGGLPVQHLRVTNDKHPLLYGVSTLRITALQTSVVAVERYGGALSPLWVGPAGPLLAAGHVEGKRLAVFAFDPRRSPRLPLMASYPLLLGNALFWASEPVIQAEQPRQLATGELVEVHASAMEWSVPGEPSQTIESPGRWVELDRVGLWHTKQSVGGSAALLSSRETVLPTLDASEAVTTGSWLAHWFSGNLVTWCVLMVLAVMLIESWLFHRHTVY